MTPFQLEASAKAPWTSTTVGEPLPLDESGICIPFGWRPSAQCLEGGPELLAEELRLLPGGEVPAPVDLVEVGEVGVDLLGPAPRRPEDLAGEHREADRERDRGRYLARRSRGRRGS